MIFGEVLNDVHDSTNHLLRTSATIGAKYNLTPPTLSDGQETELQVDSSGRLLTNPAALSGAADSIAINDGTNTANVLKSDGTAASQGSLMVAPTYLSVPFTTTSAQAVGSTDAGNYRSVSVHITSQGGSSTVTFQGSNDNTNWVTINLQPSVGGNSTGTSTTTGVWGGALTARYFRLNVTGIASGTTAGTIILSTMPSLPVATAGATQSGTWTVGSNSATGSAVPANAFYVAGGTTGGNLSGINALNMTADGVTAGSSSLQVAAVGSLYNGSTLDRARANEDVTLLASAARTTTQTSADLVNYNGLSTLAVTLDVTSAGTGSITLAINRKDAASGKYVQMLAGAAVTTNSTNVYKIGPTIAAVANSIAQDYMPRTFQIVVTANNANSMTYSVGYTLCHS